jgi:hypothetical protein
MTLLNMTQCYLLSHDLVNDIMLSVSHDLPKYGIMLAVSPFTTSRTINFMHLDRQTFMTIAKNMTIVQLLTTAVQPFSFHSLTTVP